MFGMSLAEIAIVIVVALVVVGPERLPELARTVGKTLGELRRAGNSLKDAIMFEADKKEWQDHKDSALGSEPPDALSTTSETPPEPRTPHALPPPSEPYDPYEDMEHMGPMDQWDDDDDFFLSAPAITIMNVDVDLPSRAEAPDAHHVSLLAARPMESMTPGLPWHDEIHPERREVWITAATPRMQV